MFTEIAELTWSHWLLVARLHNILAMTHIQYQGETEGKGSPPIHLLPFPLPPSPLPISVSPGIR